MNERPNERPNGDGQMVEGWLHHRAPFPAAAAAAAAAVESGHVQITDAHALHHYANLIPPHAKGKKNTTKYLEKFFNNFCVLRFFFSSLFRIFGLFILFYFIFPAIDLLRLKPLNWPSRLVIMSLLLLLLLPPPPLLLLLLLLLLL